MAGDAPSAAEYERRITGLEALVAQQAELIEAQRAVISRLESRVAKLERQLGQNSGNSGLPSSRILAKLSGFCTAITTAQEVATE